jgi:hypothetical protein
VAGELAWPLGRGWSTSSISTNETWFDRAGNFHSDALHLVERYTLIGPDHINYEVTIEGLKVFTKPQKEVNN